MIISGLKASGRKTEGKRQEDMEEKLKGQYTLREIIGQGTFGVIYRGRDEKNQRDIAVKIWNEGEETEILETGNVLFQESDRTSGMVRLYDFFTKAGMNFLVMEYLPGGTLKDYLMRQLQRNMDERELLELLKPVMETLAFFHSEKIVHCDISTDNLMFDERGQLRLIDLGACRKENFFCEKKFLKEHYSAPEQYSDPEKIGPWSDIYSLCALLYECLTGEKVPSAPERIQGAELLTVSFYRETEEKTERAIMKGLELDIRKRYFSVSLLMEALGIPEEKVKQLDGAVRNAWGMKWVSVSTQGGSYLFDRKKRISRRLWKGSAVAVMAAVILGTASAGFGRWYETTYQELRIQKKLRQAQNSDPSEDDILLISGDHKNYPEILENLKKNGTITYETENENYHSISYSMKKEALADWGISSNFGRKMYLDWQTIRDAVFYYMETGDQAVVTEEKEETMGAVLWYREDGEENIENRCCVRLTCRILYQGTVNETCVIQYDPVDQRVLSVSYSSYKRKRTEEFLTELLPVCCPEGFLTKKEARDVMEKLSVDNESDYESQEYVLNARTWIQVTASAVLDEDIHYEAKIAASHACLRN